MPKKDNNKDVNIEEQLKKNKKKTTMVIGVVILIAVGVCSFFGFSMYKKSSATKAETMKELQEKPLKDYPLEDSEKSKIYSRDIKKQTYMTKNGALLFEGTILFHNKLCANVYTGLSEFKELEKTEPVLDPTEDIIGDKIMKDAVTKYLQNTTKSEISTAETLAKGLADAINQRFKENFGYEIVKEILVTNHIVQ